MNPLDAAYKAAHDYPGGTDALAVRLGMTGAILRGKVNPNDSHHKLTLKEAIALDAIAGNGNGKA